MADDTKRGAHKPRLNEAPNGIVGAGTRTNKQGTGRDVLSAAVAGESTRSTSTSSSVTVPVLVSPKGGASTDASLLSPARVVEPQSARSEHSPYAAPSPPGADVRARSQSYNPAFVSLFAPPEDGGEGALSPTGRGSRRGSRRDAATGGGGDEPKSAVSSLWGTIRGRTPRTARKEVSGDVPTSDNASSQSLNMGGSGGGGGNSGLQASGSIDSNLNKLLDDQQPSPTASGTFSRRGSKIFGFNKRDPSPASTRSSSGSMVSATSRTSSNASISGTAAPAATTATGGTMGPPAAPVKSGGFFSKLFHRTGGATKGNKDAAALPVSVTAPVRRRAAVAPMGAQELAQREALLEAAGFAQLPGTLLGRARGDTLDAKFVLQWSQFELAREIGEGAYAMVYLAKVRLADGSTKDVALKELKLLGNESSTDARLEVAATADAVADCGFPTVAAAMRAASEALRNPALYEEARAMLVDAAAAFRAAADLEDDACVTIVNVLENLAALPPPPPVSDGGGDAGAASGAPQRLLRDVMSEVEVLSKMWHKNIVEFVGTSLELPHLAIAMQYCHKGPLSNLLADDTVLLGWDLRLKWARESAEAINYLHNLDPKIIHRDLKADNILIDSDDTAYVTDFGLSKAKVLTMMNPTGGPTLAGRVPMAAAGGGAANSRAKYRSFVEFSEIAGTPSYLAPELWRNESYTETVDVYSFGVVLWELLARDTPFRELNNEDLVAAIRERHMRPEIPKWTPQPLRILVERCWAEIPSTRPSFDQIVKVLKVLIDQEMYQWPPPENYSLDVDQQQHYLDEWEKGKRDKEIAISNAEKKLLAAREQLMAMRKQTATSAETLVSPAVIRTPVPTRNTVVLSSTSSGLK